MNNRSFRTLLLSLIVFCVPSASSQTITGIVKAKQGGHPVANASIEVVGAGIFRYTDCDGKFSIQLDSAGMYSLKFGRSSFGNSTINNIDVGVDETAFVQSFLGPDEPWAQEIDRGYYDKTLWVRGHPSPGRPVFRFGPECVGKDAIAVHRSVEGWRYRTITWLNCRGDVDSTVKVSKMWPDEAVYEKETDTGLIVADIYGRWRMTCDSDTAYQRRLSVLGETGTVIEFLIPVPAPDERLEPGFLVNVYKKGILMRALGPYIGRPGYLTPLLAQDGSFGFSARVAGTDSVSHYLVFDNEGEKTMELRLPESGSVKSISPEGRMLIVETRDKFGICDSLSFRPILQPHANMRLSQIFGWGNGGKTFVAFVSSGDSTWFLAIDPVSALVSWSKRILSRDARGADLRDVSEFGSLLFLSVQQLRSREEGLSFADQVLAIDINNRIVYGWPNSQASIGETMGPQLGEYLPNWPKYFHHVDGRFYMVTKRGVDEAVIEEIGDKERGWGEIK